MFTATIFKTQKTTLGYNAEQIIRLVERRKNTGRYERPDVFCLPTRGGVREFELIADTEEGAVIQSGLVQITLTKPAKKQNKYAYLFIVQGFYSQGWEDLTESENRAEARADLKVYRENERGSFRMIQRRELNSQTA